MEIAASASGFAIAGLTCIDRARVLTRLTGRPGSPTPALLYAGAMLGPLGGPMVAVLLPDLARSFDTSLGVALSSYLSSRHHQETWV